MCVAACRLLDEGDLVLVDEVPWLDVYCWVWMIVCVAECVPGRGALYRYSYICSRLDEGALGRVHDVDRWI